MNKTDSTPRYFEELTCILKREGFEPQPLEDDVLPVHYDGEPLGKVVCDGVRVHEHNGISSLLVLIARQISGAFAVRKGGAAERVSIAACGEVSDTEHATTREWGYDHKGLYHGHYVGANCARSVSGKSRKLRIALLLLLLKPQTLRWLAA